MPVVNGTAAALQVAKPSVDVAATPLTVTEAMPLSGSSAVPVTVIDSASVRPPAGNTIAALAALESSRTTWMLVVWLADPFVSSTDIDEAPYGVAIAGDAVPEPVLVPFIAIAAAGSAAVAVTATVAVASGTVSV
ncbi:MAG: hypothetical protein AAGE85_10905 [Pseudomonadota bacterium]